MTFKDLRQGYVVYMLDRDSIKATQGKVVQIGQPRFSQSNLGAMPDYTKATQMVIDITINAAGQTRTYEIPETSSVVNAGQLVLSVDKEGILREIQSIKAQSEDILSSVERHKQNICSCNNILEEWDTAYAERTRQEERIGAIENEVKGLGKMMRDFISEFKK